MHKSTLGGRLDLPTSYCCPHHTAAHIILLPTSHCCPHHTAAHIILLPLLLLPSPCCCWCCCCWCSCTEARPARFPPHKHHNHPKHPKQRNTYIRQPAWESPSVGEGSLPLLPLPLPAFLPLLPAAIKSASLHFLRAARTLDFNLMRVARGQWPPATGFSPGRPESTF